MAIVILILFERYHLKTFLLYLKFDYDIHVRLM